MQMALPLELEEAMEGVVLNYPETMIESKAEEDEWNNLHTRFGMVHEKNQAKWKVC